MVIVKSDVHKVRNLIVPEIDKKLHELDPHGSAIYTIIIGHCLGKKTSSDRRVTWIQNVKHSRRITVLSQSGNTVTVSADNAKFLIRDDMLWHEDSGSYFRVVSTPAEGTTSVELRLVGDNVELTDLGNIVGQTMFKFATAVNEGTRGGEGYVDNPVTFSNQMHTFRDVWHISKQKASEKWYVGDHTYASYERTMKMKKHKEDMNFAIYVGKGYDQETRQMTRGIDGFPINVQTGIAYNADGSLRFGVDEMDQMMFEKVRAHTKCPKMYVACNKAYLMWLQKLVRLTASMNFNPFSKNGNKFGFRVSELEHQLGNFEFIEDYSLNELYPNKAVGYYLDPTKLALWFQAGTELTLNCGPELDEVFTDKVITIGAMPQVIHPECFTKHEMAIS
jgi:hypothetical protein